MESVVLNRVERLPPDRLTEYFCTGAVRKI